MNIRESQYVPVLKWRQAEYQSLNRLFPSQKSDIVPLLVVPPVEYDFETRQPARSIQDHIVNFIDSYKELPRKPRPLAAGMNWQNNFRHFSRIQVK